MKIIAPFRSCPMRNRKFQKNSKNLNIPLWLHYKSKEVRKGREGEQIKIIVSFRFVPTRSVIENSIKIVKKFKKVEKYHYGFISSQNWSEKDVKYRK